MIFGCYVWPFTVLLEKFEYLIKKLYIYINLFLVVGNLVYMQYIMKSSSERKFCSLDQFCYIGSGRSAVQCSVSSLKPMDMAKKLSSPYSIE